MKQHKAYDKFRTIIDRDYSHLSDAERENLTQDAILRHPDHQPRVSRILLERIGWVLLLLAILAISSKMHAQVSVIRGSDKGSSPQVNVTAESVDANHNGLDVVCVSGCTSGGASSTTINDPTITTQKLAIDAAGKIGINNFPSSYAVTGTFYPYSLGQQLAGSSVPIVLTAAQLSSLTPPAAFNGVVTNGGTFATQSTLAAETTKVIGTVNISASQAVGISAGTAVIGHVINDASSSVIGHVIADSGSTTAVTGNVASTVADGADVTLGAKGDAKSTATDTTAVSGIAVLKEISAMEQAPASRAVTNTGTFATQATLAAETTKVIGTINVASSQTIGLAAGSQVIGHVVVDTAPSTAVTNAGTFAVQVTTTANPCMSPGATIQGAAAATSGTSAVQIIGVSGSTKIYVCSITVTGVSGTSPTFSLKYGTGTACATGGVTLWGPFTSTAATAFVMPPNSVVTPAGQELCYLDSGTTPIQNYAITYVQQ